MGLSPEMSGILVRSLHALHEKVDGIVCAVVSPGNLLSRDTARFRGTVCGGGELAAKAFRMLSSSLWRGWLDADVFLCLNGACAKHILPPPPKEDFEAEISIEEDGKIYFRSGG